MKKTFSQFLLYFMPLIALEFLFRTQTNLLDEPLYLLRSFVYCVFLASLILLINNWKQTWPVRILTISIYVFIAGYGLFQTGIAQYYGFFFSSRFLIKGVPNVESFAFDFFSFLKWDMLLYLSIVIFFIVLYLKGSSKSRFIKRGKPALVLFLVVILTYEMYLSALIFAEPKNLFESSMKLYKNPYYTETAVNQLGMIPFIGTDLQYLGFPNRASQNIEIDTEPKPIEPQKPVEIIPEIVDRRIFDDSQWYAAMNQETDANLKAIDHYFLSQEIPSKNEKSGIYEGKNFIYILVEAFDMVAIDETLTPTLYAMKHKGTYMENFYSPQFNCATAESELISLTSLYPVIGTCTMSAYYESTSPQTMFNLFKHDSYQTRSYHNWNDQFYPRSKIHPVLGSQGYKDVASLIPKLISGWQSDLTMMHGIVDDLNSFNDQPFMAYIVTSSTHFPYDTTTNLEMKYEKEILAQYPQAPKQIRSYLSKAMELDRAMAYLLDNLGSMDNTVIAMFGDHRPLNMPADYLINHSSVDRNDAFGLDHTPMIIYTPNQTPKVVTKTSSTIDMAPTIANMFNLKYDPRLFMGADVFDNKNNTVVFQSGSWYDQVGYFNIRNSKFTPFSDAASYDQETINATNASIKQKMSVSSQIYVLDYFQHRPFISQRYE